MKSLLRVAAVSALSLLAAQPASASVLLSDFGGSVIRTWDRSGATTTFHTTQSNDVDYNVSEGASRAWFAEHNNDKFGKFVPGTNTGFEANYSTSYAYPKHIAVYNGEIIVSDRNNSQLNRYNQNGALIGTVDYAGTGQGVATDGEFLYVSYWNGSTSTFLKLDSGFSVVGTFANATGLGVNNIFDFTYDPTTNTYLGLGTNGEGGTGTNSSTIYEFTMGGSLIATYALGFAVDGIGANISTAAVPEPAALGLLGLGVAAIAVRRRRKTA